VSLLNYTTEIDPDKTASEIAKCLSQHGAKQILTEYDDAGRYVSALSFTIMVGDRPMSFRLPCDWKPVFVILKADPKVPRRNSTEDQAVRTAWRIVKDWVEAQMALVETRMTSTQDVFLPYAVMNNGKTLAENMRSNPNLFLGSGDE
jgi:hypothetical protein